MRWKLEGLEFWKGGGCGVGVDRGLQQTIQELFDLGSLRLVPGLQLRKVLEGDGRLGWGQGPLPLPLDGVGHATAQEVVGTRTGVGEGEEVAPADDEDAIGAVRVGVDPAGGVEEAGVGIVVDLEGGEADGEAAAAGLGKAVVEAGQDAEAAEGAGHGEEDNVETVVGVAEEAG